MEVIDVPRMEPHGRLVQDVDEIDEVAVELPGPSSQAERERSQESTDLGVIGRWRRYLNVSGPSSLLCRL